VTRPSYFDLAVGNLRRSAEEQPLPLFEHAHARRGDPDTAHQAAEALTAPTLRASQEAVLGLFHQVGPMTDERLVHRYGFGPPRQSPSGLRSRRHELVVLGKLKDSGRREKLASGRLAVVWTLA